MDLVGKSAAGSIEQRRIDEQNKYEPPLFSQGVYSLGWENKNFGKLWWK